VRDGASAWRARPVTSGYLSVLLKSKPFQDRPVAKAATQTFSRSESAGNTLVRWKERAMPRCATRCAGVPVILRLSKKMSPDVGANVPVSRLKSVVLPAPLGPMIECSVPASTPSVTRSTALSAPKDLLRLFVSRSAIA
jgi:hypothetical protein